MTDQDNQANLQQLDTALTNLENYLNGPNDDTPTLRQNWVYLQIFATYGLRLPNTAGALQTVLNLTPSAAAGYSWFDAMYGAYDTLDKASKYFFSDVFEKMTSLGEGLKSYATDVAGQDSTFTLISSLVKPTDGSDPDPASALDILSDLKTTAANNAALAGDIKSNLATYKAKLVNAQGDMTNVKTDVDNDDRTSQATINQLEGGKEVMGSLAQLQDMLNTDKAEYKHDVIVASTTATYAWVGPLGLIAAAVVAGIYGKKAVEMKDTIDKLEGQIKAAEHKLQVAISTQNTVTLAQNSLNSVLKHTDIAIEKTTQVENSWNSMVAGLKYISHKVSSSIKMEDRAEKLAATNAIVYFMKKAQEKWTAIQPTIDQMVTDPYITVSPDPVNMTDFANQITAEAEKLEKAA